jgi:hypothetical protein
VVKNPARGRQPRGGCRHLALQLPLVPTAQPPATGAPHAGLAWLVAGGQARPPRPAPNPAVRVATDPPDQRDFGSVARVSASATVDRAVDGLAANGASTRPGGQGRPATSTWSPPPPPEWGVSGEMDASGQTRADPDGWTPHGWTPDSWTPDSWTAAGRPPDPLDDDPR